MTRQESINNAAVQFATHFIDTGETDFYGHFVKELGLDDAEHRGFIAGAKWADANPKSPWISVEDDLPCNHDDMIALGKDTYSVLVRFDHGGINFAYMYCSVCKQNWHWAESGIITHWMPIPKLEEE